jgi:hypothetical protein
MTVYTVYKPWFVAMMIAALAFGYLTGLLAPFLVAVGLIALTLVMGKCDRQPAPQTPAHIIIFSLPSIIVIVDAIVNLVWLAVVHLR